MKKNIVKKVVFVLFTIIIGNQSFAQVTKPYQSQLTEVDEKLRKGDFQGAVGILNDVTAKYPKADDVFYAKALLFGQVGNLDMALINAEEAYELAPSLGYYELLMDLYRSQKDLDKGLALMQEARKTFPKSTSIGRDLIATYGQLNKVDEATVIYEEEKFKGFHSDTLDVIFSEVFFNTDNAKKGIELLQPWNGTSKLGNVYGRLAYGFIEEGKPKAAVAVLENGLRLSNDPLLYFDLTDAYTLENKNKLAFESLKKGFESDKVDFVHKYRVMLGLLGDDKKSFSPDQVQILANTLTLMHPRIAESHMLKGEMLWKRGNLAEAKSLFLTAVGIAPKQIDAWRMLINLDIASKDLDAAVAHSKEALQANPGNPVLLYFSGLAFLVKEENETAQEFLEAALNNSTNENKYLQSIIYTSLGDLYHKLKKEAMSDVAYEEAIKLDSTNASAMNNVAYYMALRKKDLDKAAKYSFRSIELEPTLATYQDTYAWVLFQKGDYAEALKWIEKALKGTNPPSAVLVEHYGDILSQLGKTKEAVKQWQKALTLADIQTKDKEKIEEKIKGKKYVE